MARQSGSALPHGSALLSQRPFAVPRRLVAPRTPTLRPCTVADSREVYSVAAAPVVATAPPQAVCRWGAGPAAVAVAVAAAVAAASVGAVTWQRLSKTATRAAIQRRRRQRQLQVNPMVGLVRSAKVVGGGQVESREFKMALARTRQAVAVNRAVGFNKTGNTARAMVELRRALHENSICRAPLLNTLDMMREERLALYQMHLRNTIEGPATSYATLLQLRTLLDLSFDEAEQAEAEVMQSGNAFSI